MVLNIGTLYESFRGYRMKIINQDIYVDIDGVICYNTYGNYEYAQPNYENIRLVNKLYKQGFTIIIWTARGSTTKKDWSKLTKKQLKEWKVNYHKLRMDKPSYILLIDDKCWNPNYLRYLKWENKSLEEKTFGYKRKL